MHARSAVIYALLFVVLISALCLLGDTEPAFSAPVPGIPAALGSTVQLRLPMDTVRVFLPLIARGGATTQAIIIDHTTTDISLVPDAWLTQAKTLEIHFAHTSHGSQLLTGAAWLEGQNAKYNIAVKEANSVGLPTDTSALRVYDGNNTGSTTYITPDLYWDGTTGINYTKSVANTGLFGYSMWSWCGQQSSNSTATVQEYLDTMAQLETLYPSMRFVYMTGHTDGTGSAGTLFRNNNMIRDYVRANNKVLFDFADIETYDPSGGGPYYNNSDGTCTWCQTYCNNHPGYCTSLPSGCAHTSSPTEANLFCKLKGQAFWWMMARLAGWSGT